MKINTDYIKPCHDRDLKEVKAVVIHYTANAGTTAVANINYLNDHGLGYHFIIDNDGTIYQMQTLKKRAIHCGGRLYTTEATNFFGEHQAPSYYHTAEHQHTGSPNNMTLGVCFCHMEKDGKPSREARESLVEIVAMLLVKYGLEYKGGVWRHYDVTAKKCPKFFVNNDEFVELLHDIHNKIMENNNEKK